MIPISEARTILGEKYAHLTDKDIERMVVFIYNLCKDVIHVVVSSKYEKGNNLL